MKIPFKPADILLPKCNFEKWSVIACDQFTSDFDKWKKTEETVGDNYSTLKITLPEIYLEDGDVDKRIAEINANMYKYLAENVFEEYENAIIYIERTQPDGRVRNGIIGAVDLEEYDYSPQTDKPIRATEGTVLERIPPRVRIRKDASLETPHIMLLIDDIKRTVIEPLSAKKDRFRKLYDFDLMMGGGHIAGYLLDETAKSDVLNALETLCNQEDAPLLFAVGDGNHSLATAKACYEQYKAENPYTCLNSPARYALAEVGNIHDDALDFEPIYRVLFNVDPIEVTSEFKNTLGKGATNTDVIITGNNKEGTVRINVPDTKLVTGVVQDFIDSYIKKHPETKVDYIHGIDDVKKLTANNNSIGFIYEGISKYTLFESVRKSGSLPRKTFSMGEAKDKRYYLECRKIK